LRYAVLSETGKVRDNNEDSYYADGRIFIVADGMGGHRAGEIASAVAIEEFLSYESENRGSSPLDRMRGGILAANHVIYHMALNDPGLEGMGTTFTAALLEGDIYLGHVGDSRAYLWRRRDLRLLTRDHSLVEKMVLDGHITSLEARVHPQRNVILRALGISDRLEVDVDSIAIRAGDRLLLCSDGLTSTVEDKELLQVISGDHEPEQLCRRLVDAAIDHGGTDNVTVIVIELGEEVGVKAVRGGGGLRSWWKNLLGRASR
jgi:serine/threonine protein phosphatase PrpC